MSVQDDLMAQADRIVALINEAIVAINAGVPPSQIQPVVDKLKASADTLEAAIPKP